MRLFFAGLILMVTMVTSFIGIWWLRGRGLSDFRRTPPKAEAGRRADLLP